MTNGVGGKERFHSKYHPFHGIDLEQYVLPQLPTPKNLVMRFSIHKDSIEIAAVLKIGVVVASVWFGARERAAATKASG